MVRNAAAFLCLLLLAGLTPAGAAPRLTARLENATLEETLRQLRSHYGEEITVQPGVRPTKRASFDWRSAPIGAVLRDVGRSFGLRPIHGTGGAVVLMSGSDPASGLTVRFARATLGLPEIRESEVRSRLVGAGNVAVERSLVFPLVVRALTGDPDVIVGLQHVSAGDDRGRKLAPLRGGRYSAPRTGSAGFAPDERLIEVGFEGLSPGASRVTVEGELVLARAVETHRIEQPWGPTATAAHSAGAAQLHPGTGIFQNGRTHVTAVLTWPAAVRLTPGSAAAPGDVRCWARTAGGRLVPLLLVDAQVVTNPQGEQTAELQASGEGLDAAPVAVVWEVRLRDLEEQVLPFRFSAIELPLARPTPVRVPVTGSKPRPK